jgi:hypothetical protein
MILFATVARKCDLSKAQGLGFSKPTGETASLVERRVLASAPIKQSSRDQTMRDHKSRETAIGNGGSFNRQIGDLS